MKNKPIYNTSELKELINNWFYLKLKSWSKEKEAKLLKLPKTKILTPETILLFKVEMSPLEISKYFKEHPEDKRKNDDGPFFQTWVVMFGTISHIKVYRWDKEKHEEYYEYLIKQ